MDCFAVGHYGLPPRRAEAMDPQHRLALDVTREALDDAGLGRGGSDRERTGVFFGISVGDGAGGGGPAPATGRPEPAVPAGRPPVPEPRHPEPAPAAAHSPPPVDQLPQDRSRIDRFPEVAAHQERMNLLDRLDLPNRTSVCTRAA